MHRVTARTLVAATAFIAVAIACASPLSTRPSTYIIVGPDPSLTVAPDDMEIAGKVIKVRLDALDLDEGIDVGEDRITVYYANPDDLEMVTRLATEQGALVFFASDTSLPDGSPIPEDAEVVLSSEDIASATPARSTQTGDSVISLVFTEQGRQILAAYSAAHIGGFLVITRDGVVIASPRISSAITGGSAEITGSFTTEEATLLAAQFSSGPLPIDLQLLETGSSSP